jgi:hypothetical protein
MEMRLKKYGGLHEKKRKKRTKKKKNLENQDENNENNVPAVEEGN